MCNLRIILRTVNTELLVKVSFEKTTRYRLFVHRNFTKLKSNASCLHLMFALRLPMVPLRYYSVFQFLNTGVCVCISTSRALLRVECETI